MSKIASLGKNNENLPELIVQYETELKEAEANLKITGKILDLALREQGAWPVYYGQRRAELKTLMKYLDARVSAVRGRLTRNYFENCNPKQSERMIDKYVDYEQEYLSMYHLYLEVAELYEKYDAVCEAFTIRGFALRDLTTARVEQIQNS